jgi:hypothetical protein
VRLVEAGWGSVRRYCVLPAERADLRMHAGIVRNDQNARPAVVAEDEDEFKAPGAGVMGEPFIRWIELARLGHEPTAALAIQFIDPVAGFDQDEFTPILGLELTETPLQEPAQLRGQSGQLARVAQYAHGNLLWLGKKKPRGP